MRERGIDTSDITVHKAAGGKPCAVAIRLLQLGKLPEDFVEGMICEGGCLGGPSKHTAVNVTQATRKKLFAKADQRSVLENLKNYPMDSFSMTREQ